MLTRLRLQYASQIGSVALRLAGGLAALAANLLIARRMPLSQIGWYYVYATLAYFGNATLFVGLGTFLQRVCASAAHSDGIPKRTLVVYTLITLVAGFCLVLTAAGLYLSFRQSPGSPWGVAAICASLSGATYLSLVSKDLLALSRRLSWAAGFALLEQVLRLVFVAIALVALQGGAPEATAATALALALSGTFALGALLLVTRSEGSNRGASKAITSRAVAGTVVPIGLSGLLNWLQLQFYRPALLLLGTSTATVGIISLLTAVGMTGANPVFAVAAQNYLPSIYGKEENALRRSLVAMSLLAVSLAALSIPAAVAFLILSRRTALLPYLLLVPLGVLIETANNMVGMYMHRKNADGDSLWFLVIAGCFGALSVLPWLFVSGTGSGFPYVIAIGLLFSQFVVLVVIRMLDVRRVGVRSA